MKPLLHLDGTRADTNGGGAAATANGNEGSTAAATAGAAGAAGAAAAAADGTVPPKVSVPLRRPAMFSSCMFWFPLRGAASSGRTLTPAIYSGTPANTSIHASFALFVVHPPVKKNHPAPPPHPTIANMVQSPPPAVDPSTLTDEQLLSRLQRAVLEMGDGSSPDPDAPFYTLGLSSMTGAQFSGLLEQVRVFGCKCSRQGLLLGACLRTCIVTPRGCRCSREGRGLCIVGVPAVCRSTCVWLQRQSSAAVDGGPLKCARLRVFM